jgi:hypothetical protein
MMKKSIFLLSDQVIHWNIVPGSNRKNVYMEPWGNPSIEKLLNALKSFFNQDDSSLDWSLLKNGMDIQELEQLNPANAAHNHVFATWKQFPEGKDNVWRIEEIAHAGQTATIEPTLMLFDELDNADLLLIQDWGMNLNDIVIPDSAEKICDKWVIFRPFPPIFTGKLWHSIRHSLDSKGIIVLHASDLRMLDVSISKGLSWEQTVEDIITEIYCKQNLSLHPLQTAAYVIISFGHTGTLLIKNDFPSDGANPNIQLLFDSMGVEGYWEVAHPGYLPGSMELLMVLLAKEILYPKHPDQPSFPSALRAHLLASRALHQAGGNLPSGSLNLDCLPNELDKVYGPKPTQAFTPVPLEFDLFKCLYKKKHGETFSPTRDWSLLSQTKWDFYSLARRIALYGPMKALQGWNIPIAKYNFLITVDRKEIEFLHHLQSLFTEYLQKKNSQPLSIAVFGAPGSGKSFSIKQLAKSLGLPDYEIKDITFNLSQFNVDNPSDLYQAFHAVRDIALSGKTPLVFWDEFDSKSLGWLRYFLAPMEDGEFQEGQLIHYIGKSIFVFAGGTSASMEEFEVKAEAAVAEKGPDFLSRIKGFINVMGPNPVLPYDEAQMGALTPEDETTQFILAKNNDPEFIIRRAILINSLLNIGYRELFSDGELQIDDGVLNAFLLVPKYKHGTRSMQTVFKISQLFGKTKFHRSDLPPQSQMDLHVDGELFYDLLSQQARYYDGGEAFYYLVDEIDFDEAVVEKIAAGIHAIYSLVFASDKVDDPLSITKEDFIAFFNNMQSLPEGLPHDEVSQNYHNARKIPEKLAAVGYVVVPLDAKGTADPLSEDAFEHVSRLEHIRWVRHHIDNGWRYAPTKNKIMKQHDALVAWDDEERQNAEAVYGKSYVQKMGTADGELLSEYYRNLDRVITLAIPWILESVGYKMVTLKKG